MLPDTKDIVYVSISCYGTSGVDSIQVYTKSLDDWLWCQQRVTDVIADTTSKQIIVNATPKEYYITHDTQARYIRLIMPDVVLASKIYFTVNGKREGL
jgi:sulfur transfer complex TusBCD TusB component (DsrH family)